MNAQEAPVFQDNRYQFPHLRTDRVSQDVLQQLNGEIQEYLHGDAVTYGGINADVLYRQMVEKDPSLVKSEVCPEEDAVMGLHSPQEWFFSENRNNFGIAGWYTDLQVNKQLARTDNHSLRHTYGIVGLTEVYRTEDLGRFAAENGYQLFSVPFDLVLTARQISGNVERLPQATENERWNGFIGEVLEYITQNQGVSKDQLVSDLAGIPREARHVRVLEMMNGYWKDVLIPRGVHPDDEDIIIYDTLRRPAAESLDFTRRPFLVFMSNPSIAVPGRTDDEIVALNMQFAKKQYPGVKIIVPTFSDGMRVWRPELRQVSPSVVTAESLVMSLATLSEMGYADEYRRFLKVYSDLAIGSRV
jgi:hypothetical protein